MSYELRAVIAETTHLRAVTAALGGVRLGALRQGLSLLPITDVLFDAQPNPATDQAFRWRGLPAGSDRTLAAWSSDGPVAYVEAEYFGGVGEQWAAVWHRGRLIVGPIHTGEYEDFPPEGSPISQALRHLGARGTAAVDEFAAVGLGEHRRTEDWIS